MNTILRNRAFIYFDFNAPVETNTMATVVSWPLSVSALIAPVLLDIAPNPAVHQLAITRASNTPAYLRVLDMSGREVIGRKVTGNRISLLVSDLPAGQYSIFMEGGQQLEFGRFLKQ